MNKRQLGRNGFEIGEVGLGCWQLGAEWGSPVARPVAHEILSTAAETGVTLFDTADVYGAGRSETLIGEFLQKSQLPVVVATKFGRSAEVYPDNYTEKGLRDSVTGSLKRLRVETLDLIQLHCIPAEVMHDGKIFDWLRNLQRDGLIRHFGASVESVEEAHVCLEQDGLLSLQVIFNLFRQKLVDELFPRAKTRGVGIIARVPLASGLLSGRFSADTRFPDTDHRNFNRDGNAFNVGETFAGLPFDKGVELTERLKEYVPEGMSMAEMALRWILDHDAVSVVIPGASSPEQARANAASARRDPLPKELHDQLGKLYRDEVHEHIRGPY